MGECVYFLIARLIICCACLCLLSIKLLFSRLVPDIYFDAMQAVVDLTRTSEDMPWIEDLRMLFLLMELELRDLHSTSGSETAGIR